MGVSGFAAACKVSAEGADEVGREQEQAARITGTRITIRNGLIRRNLSAYVGCCPDFCSGEETATKRHKSLIWRQVCVPIPHLDFCAFLWLFPPRYRNLDENGVLG